MQTSEWQEFREKEKAFYSAMLNGWLTTKLEKDRQILTLSAAAIGLLVTLLKIGIVPNHLQAYLFIVAIILFSISAIVVLFILIRARCPINFCTPQKLMGQAFQGCDTATPQIA